jgi:hypothetical protein
MIKTNNILIIPSFGFFTSPLIPQSVFQLLSKVITKIRRVSQGELGQTTVDIQTNDEVDELDWAFNEKLLQSKSVVAKAEAIAQ